MSADPTTIRVFHQLLGHAGPCRQPELVGALIAIARTTKWRRNQGCRSIAEGGNVGCVLCGAVRKYSVRFNGQRQIVDLLMPGDFIGLVALDPNFSVEAVCDGTLVAIFRASALAILATESPAIAELMRDRTGDAIGRLEAHLLVQGRMTASEKVGGYLVAMSRRTRCDERGALVLPISRYDIADHLGLAVETVSRAMTELSRRGRIALQGPRHVQIHDVALRAEG